MTANYDRVVPYEGQEPYIFISYSHKDTDRVMSVIRVLQENGFRVWYDEGIDPGSEWPESIAQHLNGSTVCIFFISENSLQSNNCKREVNFALSKNKGFLSVVLEPVEMSLGLELQIATYMSLIRYKYASEQQFLNKLIGVDILKPCRKEPEPENKPEEPQSKQPVQPEPAEPVIETIPETEKEPAPAANTEQKSKEERRPVKPAVSERKAAKKKERTKSSGRPVKLILLGILAVALLFGGIKMFTGGGGSGNNNIRTIQIGDQEIRDNTFVKIENLDLSAADMDKIAGLTKVWTLQFYNCSFEGDSLQKLSALTGLNEIRIENCQGVGSLAFTQPMEKLKEVLVRWCGVTDEILSTLVLHDTYTELNLRGNAITQLPDLSLCPNLTALNIRENEVTSLEPVRSCTKLKALYAGSNHIADFSVLEQMIYLEIVDIAYNDVASLDFLKNTTLLKEVDFSGNSELSDLSILGTNAQTLETVVLEYLPAADLSVLSSCKNVQYLDITGCGTADLSYVSGMSALETLQAAGNSISDLSPLSECRQMKLINLAYNEISSLNGFPTALSSTSWSLYLQHNQLEDLDGLPSSEDCTLLAVQGNELKNIDGLNRMKAFAVILDYTPDLSTEILNKSTRVYVTSVDLSEQVALEKALGGRLYLMNETEAINEMLAKYSLGVPILPE